MRVLLTGAKGQLGTAFARYFEAKGTEFSAVDLDSLDISDASAVLTAVRSYRPGIIVNCAAYNLVDKAETESEKAFSVNAAGPENLARAAAETGAFLVHFGTDYVFDGAKSPVAYNEKDKTDPLNKYGAYKLEGERLIKVTGVKHLILRLSWVFGNGGQNFMVKLLEWAKKPDALTIASDEISVPTYTGDVVAGVAAALKSGLEGAWHLPNTGACSRYEWASLILNTLNIAKPIIPGHMADFKLPAQRPCFSAMTNAAISSELGITMPHWSESVKRFLKTNGEYL